MQYRKFLSLLTLSALVSFLGAAALAGAATPFSRWWWLAVVVAVQSLAAVWKAFSVLTK